MGGRVYNGITTAEWPYRSDKDDYVLFLGRLAEDKGLHVAIDASRAADAPGRRRWRSRARTKRYVEEQVRPRLGSDVELVGEATYEMKQELLAGARCLIFPILWEEPFGMVQVEAMATGTPVVALGRGSVPEVVSDGETGSSSTTWTIFPPRCTESRTSTRRRVGGWWRSASTCR